MTSSTRGVAGDPEPKRIRHRSAARPTRRTVIAVVDDLLGGARRAGAHSVPEPGEGATPLALGDPTVLGVTDPLGEGAHEETPEELGKQGPHGERVVVFSGHRRIRSIVRIKDEHGMVAVEVPQRILIEDLELQLGAPDERIVADEQLEQEDRQRMAIGGG